MRGKRILVGLVLAVALVLAIAAPALAFTDMGSCPYASSIDKLADWGMVGGYDDGTFRPNKPLWRAQFAKMAVLTMGYPVSIADVSPFLDTPEASATNPLYPGAYAAVANTNGIILGYPGNIFGFWNNLTRQQMITVTVRAAGDALADPPTNWKGVVDATDPTHGANIKKAEFNELLVGILAANGGSWNPELNATRGETAELLYRLLTKMPALTVEGPLVTEELSMADLLSMPATEGYGGWKNDFNTIVGPKLYRGVSVASLMDLVGGGTTVRAIASDGLDKPFSADDLAGAVTMWDPATGEPIFDIQGDLSLVVAYRCNGSGLGYNDGPLRMAYVSPAADQVTYSKHWVKLVTRIVVE